MKWPTESKYHNRRVVVDGITFHSVKEACRWQELKCLELAGKITGLEDTCGLCAKKGAEAARCPLQKALRSCTTLPDERIIDGCMFKPYSDAAYYGLLDEEELAL